MTSSHYKYSRVLNKILDLLSMKNSPLISLHWIPSHVSYLKARQRISITGNEIADSLATTALQSRKTRLDIKNDFNDIPCKLLHATADLVSAIDSVAQNILEPSESVIIGPSSDEFSKTDASQTSLLQVAL